jgi:hypothetical protein
MKNIFLTAIIAITATIGTYGFLNSHHAVKWQYDPWRARWAEECRKEEERKAAQAKWQREHPNGVQVIMGNGVWSTVTAGTIFIGSLNSWGGSGKPEFEPGSVELGYRSDGLVVYRTPPELLEKERQQKLDAITKAMINILTNMMTLATNGPVLP